jgi:hypothetical protein
MGTRISERGASEQESAIGIDNIRVAEPSGRIM